MINYPVITLCGSTRDRDLWISAKKQLTLAGSVVVSVGFFGHCEGLDMASNTKIFMDKLHCERIRISDAVYVLNRNGRIGLSTCDEIIFAMTRNKVIWFYNPIQYSEELVKELLIPSDYMVTYSADNKITAFVPASHAATICNLVAFFRAFDNNQRKDISEGQSMFVKHECEDTRLVLNEEALHESLGYAAVADLMDVIINTPHQRYPLHKHILYALNTLVKIKEWSPMRPQDILLVQMLIIYGLAHVGHKWFLLPEEEKLPKLSEAVDDKYPDASRSKLKKSIINSKMTWEENYKYFAYIAVDCINSVVLYKDFFAKSGLFEEMLSAMRPERVDFATKLCSRLDDAYQFVFFKLKAIHECLDAQEVTKTIQHMMLEMK